MNSTPPISLDSIDPLTRDKVVSIMSRGYKVSGLVLLSDSGKETCIVDCSAVRWLDQSERWTLMNPPCPLNGQTLAYSKVASAEPQHGADPMDFLDAIESMARQNCHTRTQR